jgi:hypothetical protein
MNKTNNEKRNEILFELAKDSTSNFKDYYEDKIDRESFYMFRDNLIEEADAAIDELITAHYVPKEDYDKLKQISSKIMKFKEGYISKKEVARAIDKINKSYTHNPLNIVCTVKNALEELKSKLGVKGK